ncbi:MAG: cupredoxin family copper-binding protein [Candidatus Eremiobacteraeota bacterium]|nr:cupredoxin family copper-binding protein [Candidatus Eremiobacteraeota bacterium]
MIALLLTALLAQASASSPPAKPAAVVHLRDFKFVPATVHVKPGDTVEWINDDADAHTVDSVTKAFDSGGLDTHESWAHVFKTAGSFAYFCDLHPYMKGVVIVEKGTGK